MDASGLAIGIGVTILTLVLVAIIVFVFKAKVVDANPANISTADKTELTNLFTYFNVALVFFGISILIIAAVFGIGVLRGGLGGAR